MRIAMTAALLALAAGCDDDDPCTEYVDYMCECHPDDPDVDCEDLRTTYEDPSAELQDHCAIALDDAQDEDDENGHACGDPEDTGG